MDTIACDTLVSLTNGSRRELTVSGKRALFLGLVKEDEQNVARIKSTPPVTPTTPRLSLKTSQKRKETKMYNPETGLSYPIAQTPPPRRNFSKGTTPLTFPLETATPVTVSHKGPTVCEQTNEWDDYTVYYMGTSMSHSQYIECKEGQ